MWRKCAESRNSDEYEEVEEEEEDDDDDDAGNHQLTTIVMNVFLSTSQQSITQ